MSKKKKKPVNRPIAAEKKQQEQKQNRTMTIALIAVAVVAVALILLLLFGGKKNTKHHIEIEVENYGTIEAIVDESVAPKTAAQFLELAESGFYDGLTFHRVISGFMIQGGDPEGNGTGGYEQKVTGEFSSNGFDNTLSHTRGVLSLARGSDYDSGSCQFFIVQADSTYLDGNYAAFGWVTSGMEIVDAICEDTPVQDSNGTVLAEDQPVITAIRVLD